LLTASGIVLLAAFQSVTALIAGRNADRARSLTIAAWNGAVAGGAAVGGVVLGTAAPALTWTAAEAAGKNKTVPPRSRGAPSTPLIVELRGAQGAER
jgi:hypothetical protein